MIRIDGPWFKDEAGRTLLLRGVNLGGSSKVPAVPDGATWRRDGLFDHREVSFLGRPFPLEEADEHFARLRSWGLTFLRFLVTWEAIEHAGPGRYDHDYLEYLRAIVSKAGDFGIDLFIDPHQDVWSRFCGGDGAPGWTLEAVGLDLTRLHDTGAALLHAQHGDPLPRMIWPTNGVKLAAATMFTLFYGGNDFAPATRIDGEPAQEYLQRHYLAAIREVALALRGLPNVVGYDTMNEPLHGFIGWEDLTKGGGPIELGERPSPLQSMALGAGIPQEVELWKRRLTGPKRVGTRRVNPKGLSAWLEGHDCVWRCNGVWDPGPDGAPRLLRPDHFTVVRGRRVEFSQDYYRPFANRFARALRQVAPDALIFVQTEVGHRSPRLGPDDAPDLVYAPHWYDGYVLFLKDYSPWVAADMFTAKPVFFPGRIRRSFARQLERYKQEALERLRGAPTLIGEFGIAFDLRRKEAYRTGDFRRQVRAMDRSMRAMEDTLLSWTLWNYTADNSNARGDQWNDEDLSIFSRDQRIDPSDLSSGGRALEAVVRPYPRKTAGTPVRLEYDLTRRHFEYECRPDPAITAPTEIFVPERAYPNGYEVIVSNGESRIDRAHQVVEWRHGDAPGLHRVVIRPG